LYDEKALAEADALVESWTHDEVSASRPAIAKDGVRALFRGKPLHEVGSRVIEIAEGGLARRGYKNAAGKDEGIHLQALKALVAKGQSPADALLAAAKSDDPAEVIRVSKLP
jgi:glutamate--cysteine ligase